LFCHGIPVIFIYGAAKLSKKLVFKPMLNDKIFGFDISGFQISDNYRDMRIGQSLLEWGASVPALFFPRNCVVCGNSLFTREQLICLSCRVHLPVSGHWLEPDNKTARVFYGRVDFYHCSSYLLYRKGNSTQKLIHALKYKGVPEAGEFLGAAFGLVLRQSGVLGEVDGIVPVPLHPKKERKRGYNQSVMIARGLSAQLKVPVMDKLVVRRTHSQSQTKKDRYSRWENARDRFVLKGRNLRPGMHLLLVDDVITTGSTLEALAQTLTGVEGIKISAVSIGFSC